MDTWNNKIINQNLQGAHGRIDNGHQCTTIDLEVPIAHGAWPSQSLPCASINKDIIHFILLPILQGRWFSSVLRFPPPITLTATEISLKVALSTKKPNQTKSCNVFNFLYNSINFLQTYSLFFRGWSVKLWHHIHHFYLGHTIPNYTNSIGKIIVAKDFFLSNIIKCAIAHIIMHLSINSM